MHADTSAYCCCSWAEVHQPACNQAVYPDQLPASIIARQHPPKSAAHMMHEVAETHEPEYAIRASTFDAHALMLCH